MNETQNTIIKKVKQHFIMTLYNKYFKLKYILFNLKKTFYYWTLYTLQIKHLKETYHDKRLYQNKPQNKLIIQYGMVVDDGNVQSTSKYLLLH